MQQFEHTEILYWTFDVTKQMISACVRIERSQEPIALTLKYETRSSHIVIRQSKRLHNKKYPPVSYKQIEYFGQRPLWAAQEIQSANEADDSDDSTDLQM